MFNLQADLSGVQALQAQVQQVGSDLSEIMGEAVDEGIDLVVERVRGRGVGSNGQLLTTKSRERIGAYSASRAKQRAKRGRSVDRIDLTDTGAMLNDLKRLSTGGDGAEGGFSDARQADKAEYLESYFGPFVDLTDGEERQVTEDVENRIERILKQ